MKSILIIVLFPLVFSLFGCSDYREINDTALVSGIAVDRGEKDGSYALSVEIVKPSASENESPQARVLTQEGETAEACLNRLVNAATKELLFSHCKLILFSEEVAKRGISEFVDYFLRSPEYRADLFLAVVSGNSAKDMLSVGEKESRVCSFDFAAVIRNSYTETGSVPPTRLYQYPADAPLCMLPMFCRADDVYEIEGTSCLREGVQYASLDLWQTKSVLLVSGESHSGEITLTAENGDVLSCRISDVKVKKSISDDLKISLELRCNLILTALPDQFDLSTESGMNRCCEELSRMLSRRIYGDWTSLRNEGLSEVFGFSVYAARYAPRSYRNGESGKEISFDSLRCSVSLVNLSYSDGGLAK